jgi:hypothetical protein
MGIGAAIGPDRPATPLLASFFGLRCIWRREAENGSSQSDVFERAHAGRREQTARRASFVAWLDRAIQYAETSRSTSNDCGILDHPLSRMMTSECAEMASCPRFNETSACGGGFPVTGDIMRLLKEM